MAYIIFLVVLIALFVFTSRILPTIPNNALWFAVASLGSVLAQDIKNLLASVDQRLSNHFSFSKLVTALSGRTPLKNYVDLIAVMTTVLIFGNLMFNVIQFEIEDMTRLGFIAFPRGNDGFVHLQNYLAGFIFLPSLLIMLGAYGIRRGFIRQPTSFWGLFGAMLSAFLFLGIMLQLGRGEFTSIKNYKLLADVNSNALPISIPLAITTAIGLILVVFLLFTAFVWTSVKLGKLLRFGYGKVVVSQDGTR
jgi:hypothetical protein